MTPRSYTLYGYWRSSASYRVRIGLHWKGLPFVYTPIHLGKQGGEQHQAPFLALNPLGQVPVLEWEEEGRIRHLAQSLAILEYLEERHPSPPLLPADPFLRARSRQMAEMVNAGIQPLQNLLVLRRVREDYQGDDQEWARLFIARGLAALEKVAIETASPFLAGKAPSLADACLVPQLGNARRFGVEVAAFPTLLAAEAACLALPAFAASHPAVQIDAPQAEG